MQSRDCDIPNRDHVLNKNASYVSDLQARAEYLRAMIESRKCQAQAAKSASSLQSPMAASQVYTSTSGDTPRDPSYTFNGDESTRRHVLNQEFSIRG